VWENVLEVKTIIYRRCWSGKELTL